jgi:hypothetical protein
VSRLLAKKPAAVEQSGWPTGHSRGRPRAAAPGRLSTLMPTPGEQTGLNVGDSAGGRQRLHCAGHLCNY